MKILAERFCSKRCKDVIRFHIYEYTERGKKFKTARRIIVMAPAQASPVKVSLTRERALVH